MTPVQFEKWLASSAFAGERVGDAEWRCRPAKSPDRTLIIAIRSGAVRVSHLLMQDTSRLTEDDLEALLYACGPLTPAKIGFDAAGSSWLLFEWPLRHALAEFLDFSLDCVLQQVDAVYLELPQLTDAGRAGG